VDPVLGLGENPFLLRLDAEVNEPRVLGKSYEIEQVDRLLYGARETSIKDKHASELVNESSEKQREAVYRILNIKNRSESEKLALKVKLAREEFQRFEGDTGSSEVQAAIASVRINELYKHCQENKKDFQNTRLLRMLVQKRQRILRYLKRDNAERYYWAINKLGLTDHIVHVEFNMDRRYMQKFKMYGDRILVKESKTVLEEERKAKRKEKKILKNKSVKELRAMKKALETTAA
jgi:small subunit ribosomal protein S15